MTSEIVRAFALSWLLAHGYAPFQADAVLRYMQRESAFQPCVESRRGHFLFQWVNPRKAALHRFAGPGCPEVVKQLEFADLELRSPPFDRFWSAAPALVYQTFLHCFGMGRC
jgi:hypothetical protein